MAGPALMLATAFFGMGGCSNGRRSAPPHGEAQRQSLKAEAVQLLSGQITSNGMAAEINETRFNVAATARASSRGQARGCQAGWPL